MSLFALGRRWRRLAAFPTGCLSLSNMRLEAACRELRLDLQCLRCHGHWHLEDKGGQFLERDLGHRVCLHAQGEGSHSHLSWGRIWATSTYQPVPSGEGRSARWAELTYGEDTVAGRVAERWSDVQGLKCHGFLRAPLLHLPSPQGTIAPCLVSICFTGPGVLLALYLVHCVSLFGVLPACRL